MMPSWWLMGHVDAAGIRRWWWSLRSELRTLPAQVTEARRSLTDPLWWLELDSGC